MPTSIMDAQAWAVGDVLAGVTVAATSLPQYIAYAELAGLAGHRGIVCSGPPLLAFAFITGCPCLCIGVTSITSLSAYAALRGADYKDAYGMEAWEDLLGAYSVMVGVASILLASSGAARLVAHIPESVKQGWKLGFAITVMGAQTSGAVFEAGGSSVKKLCVVPPSISGGASAMYQLGWTLLHPYLWDPAAAGLSALTLLVVLRAKTGLKRALRVEGVEVIVALAVGTLFAMGSQYRGSVVGMPPTASSATAGASAGAIPGGVAGLFFGWVRRWPWDMPYSAVVERLGGMVAAPLSVAAFASVDFLAILSCPSPKDGMIVSTELAGQGLGCITSGMCGSAPIGGSLSRSKIAELTGASSPLMGFVCGITTLLLAFPQVSAVLAPTPKAVLAAIVLAAVLPGIIYPKDILRLKGSNAAVAWATTIASCFLDPTKGFFVGVAIAAAASSIFAPKANVSPKDQGKDS